MCDSSGFLEVTRSCEASIFAASIQAVLTFQVIANLEAGDEVEVQVLDAGTDRPLASSGAQVTAQVVVEEDLG